MPVADLRQRYEVETPEHVVLDYEIAGLGSRALAALIDILIIGTISTAQLLAGAALQSRFPGVPFFAVIGFAQFALIWGYFALFEGLREGQTPGKKRMGIRVIQDTGHGITMRDAVVRNLIRIADFLPPPYLLGALTMAIHPRAKRLGDLAAGTIVVRDQPVERAVVREEPSTEDLALGAPVLDDREYEVLREFQARAAGLDVAVRLRLTTSLVARLADRVPSRHLEGEAFLAQLLRDETARRSSRFVTRSPGGRSAGTAQRLVAQKDGRWQAFETMADRAAAGGLNTFSADELLEFTARYREVAADLARVRTYGAGAAVRSRLERVVATGHNLLYRSERRSWRDIRQFVATGAPGAVIEARRHVVIAFFAFVLPALAGYGALRERPALGEEVLPGVMLERADEGIERERAGRGYAEARAGERPHVASAIITNNIGVAFTCFAGGIFLGVGSLLALAFNGLLIGAVSGHYHNLGLLGYLWTFIAGHGVLELFAIWCAGAAGLLLGSAFVNPGAWSRRDALVIRGRLAARLVGFCVILLLVAGLIEGFLSTSTASPAIKVGVSVASAVLLLAYLWYGSTRGTRAEA